MEYIFKHLLSIFISLATLYVPRNEWQKKMQSMPAQQERFVQRRLAEGWERGSVVSSHTGLNHIFYRYPCTDTTSKRILLLLHGFNTDGSIFFKLSKLAASHTLIAYNFPEQTEFYTGKLSDFKIIIDDFCESMHFDTLDLLGNSLGGIIAAFYAARTTEVRIDNLVLVSSYIHGANQANSLRIRKMADKLLPYPDYKLFYLLYMGGKIFDRTKNSSERDNMESISETVAIKSIAWYRQILSMLYWYNGVTDASLIKCRVLALHGGADRLVPVRETAEIRRYIPDAKVKIFEKAGHTLIFSYSDECMDEIRKELFFVNRH